MPTLKDIIRSAMTRRNLSVHDLATRLGTRDQYLYAAMKRNNCNFTTLCKIMDALGLEIRPKDPPTVG